MDSRRYIMLPAFVVGGVFAFVSGVLRRSVIDTLLIGWLLLMAVALVGLAVYLIRRRFVKPT